MTNEKQEYTGCPFDKDEHGERKYFMLAGGKIELQTKGDGSTARMFATNKDGEVFRCSVSMLTEDNFMEKMANYMHDSINAHTKDMQAKLDKAVEALEYIKRIDMYGADIHATDKMLVKMAVHKTKQALKEIGE